jgi:pimeloyl-ACP methyl ester carboxylesterase
MLKAIGVAVLAALICGYASLCLLFYQGQWQLVLHPSRSIPAPASIGGSPFQTIRFGVDESAEPQLAGWWLPAAAGARYAAYTVLYLPSGDGSLADAVPALAALHSLGINLFAFDYRGYGQSAAARPSQRRMTEDAASAWQYLTVSRAVSPDRIVLFGDGVGCALAAGLAQAHSEAPAVILQSPRPDLLQAVLADTRTRTIPVRALFHDRFDVATPLAALKTPKLLLLSSPTLGTIPSENQEMAVHAASPKTISTLQTHEIGSALYRDQITRFLDEYIH